MPVTGIESILCMDYHNFEPLLFRDSPVIIDASDFAWYYNGKDILHNICGGEYLSLAIEWNRILGDLQKCSIDPLFIFSAGSERRGFQLAYELKGFQKKLVVLKHLLKGEANESALNLNPLLLMDTLVDLLDAIHVSHLCSAFGSQRSCASLANRMKCPVLASSPEYLSLCVELPHLSYTGFSFIPLQCVNPEPVELCINTQARRSSNRVNSELTPSFALVSHKFLPYNAGFYQVAPVFRPLLFLLLGTDSLPRIRLPKSLYTLMNNIDGFDYKSRRWNTILMWLRQFSTRPIQPIDQINKCYPAQEQDAMLRTFIDCLEAYMPDISIGRRLSSFLLECPLPNQNGCPPKTTNPIKQPANKSNPAAGQTPKLDICAVLNGTQVSAKSKDMDFTENWPEDMVRCFHQSNLTNIVLVSLYSTGGVVLPLQVEDLNVEVSLWDASLPLRVLHYRYLAGLEVRLGTAGRLTGLTPQAVEYVRVGEKQIRRRILVKPVQIDPRQDTTDAILESYLGLPFSMYSGPLLSVVVASASWFKWEMSFPSVPMPIDRSPAALAILLCAVANHFNFQVLDESLLGHYEEQCLFAESKIGFNAPPLQSKSFRCSTLNLQFVHQFNGVQSIYLCLRSAAALLDQLLPYTMRSKVLDFRPSWRIFPSGRLVHALAACLAQNEPISRRHLSVRFWLPRLLRPSSDPSKLDAASTMFDWAVDTAAQLVSQQSPGFKPEFIDDHISKIDLESFDPLKHVPLENTVHCFSNRRPSTPKPTTARKIFTNDSKNVNKAEHVDHLSSNHLSMSADLSFAKRKTRDKVSSGWRTGYAERLKERLTKDGV